MKVYIASMFADKDRVKARGQELAEIGIECTSRWVNENAPHTATIKDFPDEYFRETAALDIEDILRADKLVITVPTDAMMTDAPIRSLTRGGRHFESGFMYGLVIADAYKDRELIILGKRENVFHFLDGIGAAENWPIIRQFDTWDDLKESLRTEAALQAEAANG